MRPLVRRLVAVAILTSVGTAAAAQSSDTKSTTGSTTIVQPITLTKNTDLQFGQVGAPTSGSNTVTLDTATCSPALSGGGNAYLVTGSTHSCATYTVSGEDGLIFDVSHPATFDMTRSGGAETITVTLSASEASGTIGQASADFKVGGSFDVGTSTVVGAYAGTFNVTVTYQ